MVGQARLTAYTTLEEVQASTMTGLRWATRDGAGKMCIPSLSRYEHSTTRLTCFSIDVTSLSREMCDDLFQTLFHVQFSPRLDDAWTFYGFWLPCISRANTCTQSTHLNEPENAEYAQANGFDQTFQTYEAEAYGDGPLQLSYQGYVPDSNVGFMRALEAVNVPVVNELNTGNATGVKQGLGTLDNRLRRSSSFDSFYRQAQNRSNLDVLFNAPVSELVLDTEGDTPIATGVVFVDQNTGLIHQVSASKEVILSLGAFHSPQLLMLSVSTYHNIKIFSSVFLT